MAITDSDSVLILGAGSSAPFGLPMGGQMIDLIGDLIEAEFLNPNNYIRTNKMHEAGQVRFIRRVLETQFPGSMLYHQNIEKPMQELRHLLIGQTSQTIDDFVAINPSVSKLTKIGIAAVLFHHLYMKQDRDWVLKPLSGRKVVNNFKTGNESLRRNWVHHLINLVRHNNFPEPKNLENKIKIVSFNYEGTLEHVLTKQFDNTGHNFGDLREYIEIVHPHGFMGDLAERVRKPEVTIQAWADEIHVVKDESQSKSVTEARETAKRWVTAAKNIYMAGFALSGPNAEMLGLGHLANRRQNWYVANYDGSPGLRRTIERYVEEGMAGRDLWGINYTNPRSCIRHLPQEGTWTDPLNIDTWFEIGVPGQMPA